MNIDGFSKLELEKLKTRIEERLLDHDDRGKELLKLVDEYKIHDLRNEILRIINAGIRIKYNSDIFVRLSLYDDVVYDIVETDFVEQIEYSEEFKAAFNEKMMEIDKLKQEILCKLRSIVDQGFSIKDIYNFSKIPRTFLKWVNDHSWTEVQSCTGFV